MTIESTGQQTASDFPRILPARFRGVWTLRRSWQVAAAAALIMLAYFVRNEGWPANVAFTIGVTGVLVGVLALISRRVMFPVVTIAAVVAVVIVAADVKWNYMGMVLHAYDVVFYLLSPDTLWYLLIDFRKELTALVVTLFTVALVAFYLYRVDATRVSRRHAAIGTGLAVLLAAGSDQLRGERPHTLFYWDNLYVSSFYSSWAETAATLLRGQIIEAAAHEPGMTPFGEPTTCPMREAPPHIILIHQESVIPPSYFPVIDYDPFVDPLFRSGDGTLRKLRVETYGGASWLTEFSVLAGVSTYSFGGMRTFVQSMMHGKVRDTVPQTLKRCGYDNVMFYPVPKHFVSSGKFYTSIGVDEIHDFHGQGAKRYNERDRFYYTNALNRIGEQVATRRNPLFSFILTSATHLPYRDAHSPEMNVPGGGPGTHPQMHEYLRRLALARIDLDWFRAELKSRFPNERFLIVQYGDHQPIVTRPLLGFSDTTAAQDVILAPESPGFLTYYAVEGINLTVPPLPDLDVLDVPYLGTVLLKSAGLPLSPAGRERMRLMERCKGRYYQCEHQSEILAFHRRLIDSGLIIAR
ncbi:MAG: sulfatase-like hydrolase/transferase [Hyphomicrobiaceae bacterium]